MGIFSSMQAMHTHEYYMKFAIYEMYDNGIQFTRESNFITEIIYSPFNISIEGIQVLLIS